MDVGLGRRRGQSGPVTAGLLPHPALGSVEGLASMPRVGFGASSGSSPLLAGSRMAEPRMLVHGRFRVQAQDPQCPICWLWVH